MANEKDQQVKTDEETPDDLAGEDLIAEARKAGMKEAEINAIKKAQAEMGEEDEALETVAKGDEEEEAEPAKKPVKAEEEEAEPKKKDKDADEEEESEEEADKGEAEEEEAEEEAEPEAKKPKDEDEDDDDSASSTIVLLPVEKFDMDKVEARYTDIRKQKTEINTKLVSGDITAEEATEQLEKLDDARQAIKDRIANSERNAVMNSQMQQTLFAQSRASFLRRTEDLNYREKANVKHFDRAVNMLLEEPEFAKKGFDAIDDLLEEAHRMVLARVGKAAPAKKPATKTEAGEEEEPAPAKKPDVKAGDGKNKVVKLVPKDKTGEPRSTTKVLAGLPAAHKGEEGEDDVVTSLKGLEGEELERALGKLSSKDVERVLRKLS